MGLIRRLEILEKLEVKPKAMFKSENGFILTKRQMKTADGDIWWQFSKCIGDGRAIFPTSQTFEEHGYEIVPWDDEQIASDGSAIFTKNDESEKI